MESNATDSGNRVTRSLRKRITSVDSDNSSRPGTPVPSKLISISEISASPSRSTRMTRRNSTSGISTPVKTPAKRAVASSTIIAENTETITPARRSTRRRSVSVHENDETVQPGLKIPSFAPVGEEIASTDVQTSRVTRSQSKSPQQNKSKTSSPSPKLTKSPNENKSKGLEGQTIYAGIHKRRKPGPKSRSGEHDEDVSDVEISVLENEMEEIKNKSSNITTIVLTDDESNQNAQTNMQEERVPQDNDESKSDKNVHVSNETNNAENESSKIKETPIVNNTIESTSNWNATDLDTKSNVATTTSISTLEKPICATSEDKQCDEPLTQFKKETINSNAEEEIQHALSDHNEINNSVQNTTDNAKSDEFECDDKNMQENEINSSIAKDVENNSQLSPSNVEDCTTPQGREKTSSVNKIEIISVSTLTPYRGDDGEDSNVSDCKASSKKVDFVSSPSNDMTIRNVYPKTPASTKTSSSFIEINSSRDDDGSFKAENNTMATHSDDRQNEYGKNEMVISNEGTEGKREEPEGEVLEEVEAKSTPIRAFKCARSLEIAQSSTPINIEVSKPDEEETQNKTSVEIASLNDEVMADEENEAHANAEDDSSNENDEKLKWINPSVKGATVEGSKLDAVVTRNDTSATECHNIIESLIEHDKTNKKKSIIFSSDDEGEDDEGDVEREQNNADEDEDNDAECELAPGEKPYKRKHDFHDDEAMEVDDYESGDSMDSEERRDLEENEIQIDGESIGSHTTDDEYVEEEDSENADSFIVSDNEELECSGSNHEEELINEDIHEHNRKKKKTYKRLQRPTESSSSDEEDIEMAHSQDKLKQTDDENVNEMSRKSESNSGDFITETNNLFSKSSDNIVLDSSKLSDSALRLHCTAESESDEVEVDEEKMNVSRKEILRKLNQSDRFNKSVRDLNPEIDTSPVELEAKTKQAMNNGNIHDGKLEYSDEGHTTSTSPDQVASKAHDGNKLQSESHLGEVSVTSESDGDKENEQKSLILPHDRKLDSGLSVSFGSYKKPQTHSKGRQEWQRSFTIDVSVKNGDLETAVTDVKMLKEQTVQDSSSSTDDNEKEQLIGEDLTYLENVKHMPLPLSNPLIRTRRQSLALPTNPDMEICSSSHGGGAGKKTKRKSLGILSGNDFNPSQSFIDSIELHKSELNRQVPKRKRLSKSFCGASETLDNSVIDIDVRHLHKRSKLVAENSMAESQHDSIENIDTSKLSTKISSTPHGKTDKNDSNNNILRILSRCDEILEAANRAKLKAKIDNKKSKNTISKKLRKKPCSTLPKESTPEDALRGVSKEIKRKDKTKTALSQAIKAADAILGKKKQTKLNMEKQDEIESKQLAPDVLETIEKSASIKKKSKKGITPNVHTTLTSAGNFKEMPQTPEKKKKKPTYIQLPTGKVSVEPVTPKKRSVRAFNGTEFRESPITPYAIGFKVRQIPLAESNESSSFGKRKRNHDEKPKERASPKSQWTQSGLFVEEDIPKNRRIARSEATHLCGGSRKTKLCLLGREEQTINRNFKENAMMRPDIKRSTKREILLLKERRQIKGHY